MRTIVWQPKHPEASQLWQFMQYVSNTTGQSLPHYHALHAWSVKHPEMFWSMLCDFFNITFDTPATCILNDYTHMLDARWFEGASFNMAQKLLSRDDDKLALISRYESGERASLSYRELKEQVRLCAGGLSTLGIKAGDRVAAVMPNGIHTIIAMLATVSLGAIWSSCSLDFGAQAIIDRFGQITPKVLFTIDTYSYQGKSYALWDKIREVSQAIPSLVQIVVCPTPAHDVQLTELHRLPQGILWSEFLHENGPLHYSIQPFAHPVYILFSSGTTGKPKCIIHSAGGTLLQHIKELALHTDLRSQDNLCFYTTCGWMMWNWMVSALALGTTLTLYEGSPTFPDPLRLFKLIEQEGISVFGTSAKFISAIEKSGEKPRESFSLPSLRSILSTGSPLLPPHYDFVYQHIKPDVQLASISGGTDIISCFALGNPLLPVYRGELQCLGLGMSVQVFNQDGVAIQGHCGELVCTKPFPSMPVGFWHDPYKAAYERAYFTRFRGVWTHGDLAELTKHQGLILYGRSDAVLNPGGVRIGTAEIYRQVETFPNIVDSVVITQPWDDDVRMILFVQLQPGLLLDESLIHQIRQTLRRQASPRHVPSKIIQVPDIPRTMNGKIVEIAVRQTVLGEAVNNLGALANPEALAYFRNRPELEN